MVFPTIPTAAAGRVLTAVQANTTATRTFPNLSGLTKSSGDMLIAIVIGYQSSATANAVWSGWTAGWTEFVDQSTTTGMCIGAAYKISNGTETGTISVTQAATITGHAAMILLSIPGVHQSTAPTATAIANGTTAAADPAALDPANWATEDTLWIAVGASGETSTTGSYTGIGSPTTPTNYTNIAVTGISGDVVGGVEGGVAFRQVAAASENVGTWGGVDTSNARNSALLIAVRPMAYTQVTATRSTTWNTRAEVTATRATTWNVAATGGGGGGLGTPTILHTPSGQSVGPGITTGTISPTANALVVVVFTLTGGAADTIAHSATDTSTSGLTMGSWSVLNAAPAAATSVSTHVFYAIAGGTPGSGTITVTAPGGTFTDGKIGVFEVTGADTTTPVVGDASWTGVGNAAPSVTLSATPNAADLIIGAAGIRNDSDGMTPGTNFTELWDVGTTNPSASTMVEYDTGSTSTTVDLSGASTVYGSLIGFIIKPGSGLTSVTSSLSTTWKVDGQITSTRATTWHTTATVTATRATTWHVTTTVTATRATTWHTLAARTNTRATTWNVVGQVTATRSTTYHVLSTRTATRATTWHTYSTATTSRSTTWRVLAPVTATRATTWRVLAPVTGTRATTWNVQSTLTATRATSWNVIGQITSTRATTWNVQGLTSVTATRATTWRVLAPVSGTRATTWHTAAQVAGTRATTWHTRAALTSTRATTWRVLAAITNTRSSTWHTAAQSTATRATTWHTLARLGNATRATTWHTYSGVTQQRSTLWNVASTIVSVTATRSTTWNVIGRITGQRTTTWHTYTTTTATRATTWSVLAPVSTSRSTTWRVAGLVTATRSTLWGVGGRVTGSTSTTWHVYTPVTTTRATLWNVLDRKTRNRTYLWNVLAQVTAQRSTLWSVLVEQQQIVVYRIVGPTTGTAAATGGRTGVAYTDGPTPGADTTTGPTTAPSYATIGAGTATAAGPRTQP
jgi:hypothetical protein